MIQLDFLGQSVSAPEQTIARVRDLAAAEAGRSASARDLSVVPDRALETGAHIALHRGEARALIDVLTNGSDDAELAELTQTVLNALTKS